MPATLRHHLLYFSRPFNPSHNTLKLFPSATATTTTPSRRYISCLSATSTPTPLNLPDSTSSLSSDAAAIVFDDYQLLFSSQPAESTEFVPLLATDSTLPVDFPLGTYYLIGPGMISDDHGSTLNPIDDHRYLHTFRFTGGGTVLYSARYVETEAAKEEREAETGEWWFR